MGWGGNAVWVASEDVSICEFFNGACVYVFIAGSQHGGIDLFALLFLVGGNLMMENDAKCGEVLEKDDERKYVDVDRQSDQ